MTRRRLTLVGIGLGHPDHLTLEAVHALQSASVALVTVKRTGDPLAAVRRDLLAHHAPRLRVVEVVDPERDRSAASTSTTSGYEGVVGDWHEARAQAWEQALLEHPDGDVVVLVWGDPAFYDSTIRVVERVLARSAVAVDWSVLPGISALQLLAARHRVVLHEGAADLDEGLSLKPLPGHTPGHIGLRLQSEGEELLIAGDALISGAVHFAEPDVAYALDSDAAAASATRRALLAEAAQSGTPIAATHLPFPGLGRVEVEGDAWRFVPL